MCIPNASIIYDISALFWFVLAVIEEPLMKKFLYWKSKKINVPVGTKRKCSFSEEGLTVITNSEQIKSDASLVWRDAKEYCEMGNYIVIHFKMGNAFVPVEVNKITQQEKDEILLWLQSNQVKELPPKKKVRRKRALIQIPVIIAIIFLFCLLTDHFSIYYYCRGYQAMSGNNTDDITISIYNSGTGKLVASGNEINITEKDWKQSEQ